MFYADIYHSVDSFIARFRPDPDGDKTSRGNWFVTSGVTYMEAGDYLRFRMQHDTGATDVLQGGAHWQTWASFVCLGRA